MGRAQRRAAARALGVSGQVWTARKAIQLDDEDGLDPALLAAAIVGALIEVHKAGGDPMLHSQVTIGSDHPDYPDTMIIEVVTDQRRRDAAEELGAPLTLGAVERAAHDYVPLDDGGVEVCGYVTGPSPSKGNPPHICGLSRASH